MDYRVPAVRDFEVDLESGCSVSGDDTSEETFSGFKEHAKAMVAKVCSRFIDGSIKTEDRASLVGNVSNSNGVSGETVIARESNDDEGKKAVKEKRKKSNNKKPPRPPKPPRGPSLDSADLKLIKEISELAMLKRARIERMKALKKTKAAKQSTSNSSLFAMVFTLLFCLVIFQGMSSRGTSVSFQGSPLSARLTEGGLIAVQFSGNPSASDSNVPSPGFPKLLPFISAINLYKITSSCWMNCITKHWLLKKLQYGAASYRFRSTGKTKSSCQMIQNHYNEQDHIEGYSGSSNASHSPTLTFDG